MFEDFAQMHQQIRHEGTYEQLKNDPVEHLWVFEGDNYNLCSNKLNSTLKYFISKLYVRLKYLY